MPGWARWGGQHDKREVTKYEHYYGALENIQHHDP